jgi:hypothetical protein
MNNYSLSKKSRKKFRIHRSQCVTSRGRLAAIRGTAALSRSMSALPPKADIVQHDRNVRFVPKADIGIT